MLIGITDEILSEVSLSVRQKTHMMAFIVAVLIFRTFITAGLSLMTERKSLKTKRNPAYLFLSGRRHKLIDIITISICAVICGADGYEAAEEFGNAGYEWFETFSELPRGIPSHDITGRVFSQLIPKNLRELF